MLKLLPSLTKFSKIGTQSVSAFTLSSSIYKRNLNIHEYQSKELMHKFGINTQKFGIIEKKEDLNIVDTLGFEEYVVKAQVHAGGRGKGHFKENNFKGGVHVTQSAAYAKQLAEKMLGNHLITKQTPPEGVPVNKVAIVESKNFEGSELYLAIVLDRESGGPVMVASPEGGMDIEEVAEITPELIYKEPINILTGIKPEQTKKLAEKLGLKGDAVAKAQVQMGKLYDLFIKSDATQIEINPFCQIDDGEIYCIDAKINFDDNASFRQKEIFDYHDPTEEDPREVAASKWDLNYIGMTGNIGCMVNGAGLAMATMDIIKLYKGSPANFLDVGGGASEKQVVEAFKILDSDPQVKAILVNIFGGIMKCDIIASGVVNAANAIGLKVPLVVRLEGTNVTEAKKIIKESGLNIINADDLDDAAQKAVAAIQ